MYLYSFGIQSIEQIKTFDPKYQSQLIYIHPSKELISNIGEIKEEYIVWIIKNCLCEMNEIFLNNIEKMREFSLLFDNFPPGKVFRIQEFRDIISKDEKWKMKKIKDKIKDINSYYQEYIPKDIEKMISINKARNCIIHNNGFVRKSDFNTSKSLIIKWKKLDIYIKNEKDDRIVLDHPVKVENDHRLFSQIIVNEKEFLLNDRISFNEKEFNESCFFFLLLAKDMENCVGEYSRSKGYIPSIQ